MPETLDSTLLFRILQQIQESQAATQATLARLERAVVRHDRKFAEADQRFNHIDQRFSHIDQRFGHLKNRLNEVQTSVRDVADELESVIKLEIGGIAGMVQAQVGHRLDALEDRVAALEQGPPP